MASVNAPSSVNKDGTREDLEFHDDVFRIKTSGYTILRGVWSAAQCAAARDRLDQLRDDHLVSQGKPAGSQIGFSTGHLYNKGAVFEGVYQAARVLRLVRHFLGTDATIMSLGDMGITGTIMAPQPPRPRHWGDESGLHNDGSVTGAYQGVGSPADERQRITSHVLYMQAIWCLSEFSKEHGGTVYVPGSHLVSAMPVPPAPVPGQTNVVGQPGDVFLYTTALWHASGINTSPQPRYAILSGWTRPWLARLNKPPPKPAVFARALAKDSNAEAIFGKMMPGPGSTEESIAEAAAAHLLLQLNSDVGKAKALLDLVFCKL
jgi:hypothetical protein